MKKLLTIVLIFMFSSCMNGVQEGYVITSVEAYRSRDGVLIYYIYELGSKTIYTKRLLYQVGDTLKFCK